MFNVPSRVDVFCVILNSKSSVTSLTLVSTVKTMFIL